MTSCIEDGLKNTKGNFWVTTSFYKDPTITTQNVLRIKGRACRACPTPTWMQNVWRYNRATDELIFLWAVPTIETCQHYEFNKAYIPPEEYCLLQYVLDFHSGELDRICLLENKEI